MGAVKPNRRRRWWRCAPMLGPLGGAQMRQRTCPLHCVKGGSKMREAGGW